MAPGDLDKALCGLSFPKDENVLVGLDRADDAGIYKISEDLALIQTVDFFTPIVDDPYHFGRIAAANALSDVYAMGGEPKTAMNLVAFPSKKMNASVLRGIIQGGIDKITEAGAVLLGGHSIEDNDIKYGLSVTGTIHPDRILKKGGIERTDRLILTKPLGIGIVNTAIKAGLASEKLKDRAICQMAQLNKTAAQVMRSFNVTACTDVTGFGLLGHLAEMVCGTGLCVRIDSNRVPILSEALQFADMGLIPTAAYNNRQFREQMIRFTPQVPRNLKDVLFDPQTSGGLLICVKAEQADDLVMALKDKGVLETADIGEIDDSENEIIIIDQ